MHRKLIIRTTNRPKVMEILANQENQFNIKDRNLRIKIEQGSNKTTLIGYDGEVKATYPNFNQPILSHIFRLIDHMPMRPLDRKIRLGQ